MGLDFLPKYNNWEKVDPAELYEAETAKKEANPKLRMNDFLASEGKGVDYLVLWLDCDKEGENICFEVLDAVQHVMRRPYGNEQTVFRAHFSAITVKDIHQVGHLFVQLKSDISQLYNWLRKATTLIKLTSRFLIVLANYKHSFVSRY